MITGKTIALTIWAFVGKVISLLFNTLSRFFSFPFKEQVSFNFMAAVTIYSDLGAQENKSVTASTFLYLPRSDGTRYHDLNFL